MDKVLAHVSWPVSGAQSGGTNEDEIPLPVEDDSLIDTQYIHWGYLNSCQIISKSKKIKEEKWSTYWVELCGSKLKFYIDSSLHNDANQSAPPSSPACILEENETTVAFYELKNAEVKLYSDEKFSRTYQRKSKKSNVQRIYRRHLFQLKLRNIRSTYVFQAPSHSAMLRWVSKIQECIDAIEQDKKSELAEERLKLAREMMARKKLNPHGDFVLVDETDAADADDEDVQDETESVSSGAELRHSNPAVANLREQLIMKQEKLWQFEVQIIDFLGRGKGDFKRDEFMCVTKQDYFLVPGRIETFIPAGTKVMIFGQLPNRRWRCLVEMNELIKVMNVLVTNLKSNECKSNEPKSSFGRRDLETLENLLNNLPEYPLIGCLPTSLLDMNTNEHDINFPLENNKDIDLQSLKSNISDNIDVYIGDIEIKLDDSVSNENITSNNEDLKKALDDLKVTDLDACCSEHSDSDSASEGEKESQITKNNVRLCGTGIIIRKKLRQKGISIIVGSSSSEDEDEDVKCNGVTNAAYQLLSPGGSKTYTDWRHSNDYDLLERHQQTLPKALSCSNIECYHDFTPNHNMLYRFGQQSIHQEQDKALADALRQVFHDKKGPDVKPPRNERRTLKLSKSDDQGYGFWLQTYDFGKTGTPGKKRTFVRYVEDEGPAYLAGLREGDVIVEVNEQDVEEIEHMKIVGLISETAKQLILVVKFMDMVRRVELAVRLKKSQAKLKVKREQLEKLKEEENELCSMPNCCLSKDDSQHHLNSGSLDGALNKLSLDTPSQSNSSLSSSSSDEVVVRTSKFEKRSSRVLDSIKELNCACTASSVPGYHKPPYNKLLSTTENDLLSVYSDNICTTHLINGMTIKRNSEYVSGERRNSCSSQMNERRSSCSSQSFGERRGSCSSQSMSSDIHDLPNDMVQEFSLNEQVDDIGRTERSKSYKRAVNSLDLPNKPS